MAISESKSAMQAAPDFLCVGMHKGGTRWLFDQLQHHPDFWMPPLKELHYLDRGDKRGKNAKQALDFARGDSGKRKRQANSGRAWDERDIQFLAEMASHHRKSLSLQDYGSLFRLKGDHKSGDITPHYCDLDEKLVSELSKQFPEMKTILLVRDPIKRAWSHISMVSRHGSFDETLLRDPQRFSGYLAEKDSLQRLSYASRAAIRWSKHFSGGRFRYFFMEDISASPAQVRHDIISFIGADPAKPSGSLAPDHNPKSKSRKLEMSDPIRSVMIEQFADELRACASVFGGRALNWLTEYQVKP